MELLDDLDVVSVKSRTFKKNIDIRVEEESKGDDDFQDSIDTIRDIADVSNTDKSTDVNFNQGMNKKVPPSIANLFGSSGSLLDKIKRRLNGEDPQTESRTDDSIQYIDTQKIDYETNSESDNNLASQTQVISLEKEESTQVLSAAQTDKTQSISALTSDISQTQQISSESKLTHNKSPSYEIDDQDQDTQAVNELTQSVSQANENSLTELVPSQTSTQLISKRDSSKKTSGLFSDSEGEDYNEAVDKTRGTQARKNNKLFLDSDSENEEEQERNEESNIESQDPSQIRLKKIEQLAAKKRAERLLREQQERDKDQKELADYKHLSDPIGEYEEHEADVSVSTTSARKNKAKWELEEEEYERQTAFREQELQHEEKVIKKFDKNSLLAAFGMIKDTNSDNTMSSPQRQQSSPGTSPMQDTDSTGLENALTVKEKSAAGGNIQLSDLSKVENDAQLPGLVNHDQPENEHAESKDKSKFVLRTPFNFDKSVEVVELDSGSDSDEEVKASKVTMLEVKSKFSKRTIEKAKSLKKKQLSRSRLISHLQEKARSQLKNKKTDFEESHKDIINEVATEQEAVDNLLDKYVMAAQRTKEKEQEMERRRKEAEMAGEAFDDEDYDDDDSEFDEVPESDDEEEDEDNDDVDKAQNYYTDDQGEGEDQDINLRHVKKRSKVLSDGEDEDEDEDGLSKIQKRNSDEEIKLHLSTKNNTTQGETSINWGGDDSIRLEDGGATQKLKMLNVSMSQAFEKGSPNVDGSKDVDVFEQLRKNNNKVLGEESFVESSLKENSFSYSFDSQKPRDLVFDEPSTQLSEVLPPTQGLSTQNDSIATLHDSMPQASLQATMKDDIDLEANVSAGEDNEDNDDDEERIPRRRLIKKTSRKSRRSDESEDDDDEEETEEQIAQRRAQVESMKAEIRKKEKEQKRKRLEMKRKGLDKIMEDEAEESEDEWKGIGGIDGEASDEENSEDEKMLDDYSKVNFDRVRSEIEKRMAIDGKKNDENLLNRILKDLETGGFRSRGAKEDLGLDITTQADAVMERYYKMRNGRMKEKMLENANVAKLEKDAKRKAFFETIAEDSQNPINEIFGGGETDNDEESVKDDEEDDPFTEKKEITKDQMQDADAAPKKRKFKVTEAYVQKTLSFLNDDDDDEIVRNSALASHQHGFVDDDDDFTEDLATLKQKSIIRLPDTTPQRKSTIDLTHEEDQSPTQFFKMPSKIMKSFQSNSNDSFKNRSEVTVSSVYKAATSPKASIMSFGKSNSTKAATKSTQAPQDTRVLKARKIERTLKKTNKLKKLNMGSFE